MKAKRTLFIILGWLFMVFQLAGYLGSLESKKPMFKENSPQYIIGFNFMIIFGAFFLFLANRQKKKIKRRSEEREFVSFLVRQQPSTNHDSQPI
jgi:quinol-cytochrome oxidoreductase complex cytochrome b subunit